MKKNAPFKLFFLFFVVALFLVAAIQPQHFFEESPLNSPEQQQKTFVLDKSLKIQLVASEPMVQDPVVINFDADGRLWVVEMRGYMPDIEGNNESNPIGRVSVLEDQNNDGVMDKSTIYLDSLVLPRAMALIKNGILIAENQALYEAIDLNGDLKADTKTLIDKDYAGSAAPEHAGNGLLRNIDNWYYNAKSRLRYKKINDKWVRDSTEFRGQWGISQDDNGRLHYNYNWSQLHADLVPPNYLSRNKNHTPSSGIDHGLTNDRHVYPIRPTPAVNRGYIPGTLDQKQYLLEFTAACSPFVYRENTLPKAYLGNVFVCEPAGNLVKRNVIQENGIEAIASDPNPKTEFLASTDERFRPVSLSAGPDGGLYIADMYKGVIQHKIYETPYIKEQYRVRGLDKHINKGRIWRIVPQNWTPKSNQKLSKLNAVELVSKLSSPNGWIRDLAQKLLVEYDDKSIEKQLINLLKNGNNLARLHALWTLEGLNLTNAKLLMTLVNDKNVLVSNSALRILEKFVKNDPILRANLALKLQKIAETASINQNLQIVLSSYVLEDAAKINLIANVLENTASSAIMRDAAMSSIYNIEFEFLKTLRKLTKWQTESIEKQIFLEMLTAAIVKKGNAKELAELLGFLAKKEDKIEWHNQSILMSLLIQSNTLTNPIRLDKAPIIFAKDANIIESYNLEKLSKMFVWEGHIPTKKVEKDKISLKPEEQKMFSKGRIQYLSTCAGCHGSDGKGVPRFAPTLAGSEWVTGNETRLALIVLHGIEGAIEVKGKKYDAPEILPVMPAHSSLDDATITNILTYIRNEWGNNAGPLTRQLVSKTRHTTQGRVVPWSINDLNKHIDSLRAVN